MHDDLIYAPIPTNGGPSVSPIRGNSGRLDVWFQRQNDKTLIYINGTAIGENPHLINLQGNREIHDYTSGKVWEYRDTAGMANALHEIFKLHGLDYAAIRMRIRTV